MAIEINARKVAYVPHVLGILVTMMMLYWWSISYRGGFAWDLESPNKTLVFNLHPFMLLIGFIILGGEAMISYKSLPFERATNRRIHVYLHIIAVLLGLYGTYAATGYNDEESNIQYLRSLHYWIGYIALLLYAVLMKVSYLCFGYKESTNDDRRDLIKLHVSIGLCTFGLAVGNSVLGFFEMRYSGADMFESEAFLVNLMAIITIVFGSFVIFVVYIESPPLSVDNSYTAI